MHLLNFFTALTLLVCPAFCVVPFDDWPHGRIALDDVSIHFRYSGSGPPLLLIHGNPQYSLTWRIIGPLLSAHFTVIAPDNRGAGDSSIPPFTRSNYTAAAHAFDYKSLLEHLNISSTYILSHDKGVGIAVAFAALFPQQVKSLVVSEYALPSFGYEQAAAPAPFWDLYANWQLAFFSVPDAAEFFIRGREKDMLNWYFFHGSYSGITAFSEDVVNRYASSLSKPGFLRAMFGPFESRTVAADGEFFKRTVGEKKLDMPVLALGGEASLGPMVRASFENVSANLETDVVPKAGHWIGEFLTPDYLGKILTTSQLMRIPSGLPTEWLDS